MKFNHLVVKVLCKRMLIDHRAQPVCIEVPAKRVEINEAPIDIYRGIRGFTDFDLIFSVDDLTLRFGLSFADDTAVRVNPIFVRISAEDAVNITYPKGFKGIDNFWLEEVMDEILSHVEQYKHAQYII